MSFLVYFAILVVAAAGALFGLDLMTAPLPSKPFVPIIGTVNPPDKLEQRVAAQRDQAAQGDAKQALSPVYPANPNPAGEKKEVRTVYPPSNVTTSNVTTGAASTASSAPGQPQTDQTQPAAQALQEAAASLQHLPQSPPSDAGPSLPPTVPAKDEPKADVATAAETKPSEQSAEHPASRVPAQPTANRCDLQACGAAYHSFRAADCTYQPFEGPRRACVAPPAAQPRSAERPRLREYDQRQERTARAFDQARAVRDYEYYDDEELPAVARPRPVQPVDDNEDDDYDAPRPPGLIMIDPGYRRPWR